MNIALGEQRPPHEPAALARHILAQSRFRMFVQAHRPHTWWDTLSRWLSDRWSQLMDAFSRHVHIGGKWSLAAGDVLIAAIVALIIAIVVRLLLTMVKEPGAASSVLTSALPVHADAIELQAAAAQAAGQGAFAAAIALLFQAALALLDARGLVRDDPARTVNECRGDVRRRAPSLSSPFDRIARIFTAAVYAEDRMSPAQWTQAQEAYATFTAVHGDAA